MDDSGYPAWVNVFHQHLDWYPLMQLRDAYKLLYQASMGSEHMVPTQQEFTRRLALEVEHLLPDPHQRLLEPVRDDQSLFRLNLRAYKSHRLDLGLLVPWLLETAKLAGGTKSELLQAWTAFILLCERGELVAFQVTEVHKFARWLEREDFPTVHHSEIYCREYQPAYRLISAEFISNLGLPHAS